MITHVQDHAERARNRLASQFKGKENWQKLVAALVGVHDEPDGLQEIENVAQELLRNRGLQEATGAQLDDVGELVGETRRALDQLDTDDEPAVIQEKDERYRTYVGLRVAINNCSGSPDELMAVLKQLTDPEIVRYWDVTPGNARLLSDGADFPGDLLEIMQSVAPAGVRVVNIERPFGFADEVPAGHLGVYGPQGQGRLQLDPGPAGYDEYGGYEDYEYGGYGEYDEFFALRVNPSPSSRAYARSLGMAELGDGEGQLAVETDDPEPEPGEYPPIESPQGAGVFPYLNPEAED